MNKFNTPLGEIKVKVLGHASIMIEWNGKHIYSDPYSEVCSFAGMPKADLVLITHNHYDHYDLEALNEILAPQTVVVTDSGTGKVDKRYFPLAYSEKFEYEGVEITAVPAYNILRFNEEGNHFHPKGFGNGYILSFGGFRLYIAGDTECTQEMKSLKDIDIAFLPKNLPYTMKDEEFIEAANILMPRYLYPIHYFELDTTKLREGVDKRIELITE